MPETTRAAEEILDAGFVKPMESEIINKTVKEMVLMLAERMKRFAADCGLAEKAADEAEKAADKAELAAASTAPGRLAEVSAAAIAAKMAKAEVNGICARLREGTGEKAIRSRATQACKRALAAERRADEALRRTRISLGLKVSGPKSADAIKAELAEALQAVYESEARYDALVNANARPFERLAAWEEANKAQSKVARLRRALRATDKE